MVPLHPLVQEYLHQLRCLTPVVEAEEGLRPQLAHLVLHLLAEVVVARPLPVEETLQLLQGVVAEAHPLQVEETLLLPQDVALEAHPLQVVVAVAHLLLAEEKLLLPPAVVAAVLLLPVVAVADHPLQGEVALVQPLLPHPAEVVLQQPQEEGALLQLLAEVLQAQLPPVEVAAVQQVVEAVVALPPQALSPTSLKSSRLRRRNPSSGSVSSCRKSKKITSFGRES